MGVYAYRPEKVQFTGQQLKTPGKNITSVESIYGRSISSNGLDVRNCIQDNTNMSEVMTIRVDRKTKARLEKLAKVMDRTKSYVAAEAIRAYVDLNEWQIQEIKAALKEADAGDFATEEEVQAVMRKWRRGAG
jgi:RHH-type transcriptional regulator, rel operon repressor / antitoxin RelB